MPAAAAAASFRFGITSTSTSAINGLKITASANQPKPLRPRAPAAIATTIAPTSQKSRISITSPFRQERITRAV
jgi:hypothetical protein